MQPAPTDPEDIDPGPDLAAFRMRLETLAELAGFDKLGITGIDLEADGLRLGVWLAQGRHGSMAYMARHGSRRYRPAELEPGTIRVVSLRMNYWPRMSAPAWTVIDDPTLGYVSRYAVGRDYHKLIRRRLDRLCRTLRGEFGEFRFRVYTDSAPVLEKPLARNAGLGFIGKHTNLIDPAAGSLFFLGEIYTDLPLAVDAPFTGEHCGSCRRCIDVCPTAAIVAPFELDARRCISYLTIEHDGSIPEPLRPLLGNRIYGCDDCQLVCPWNKFAGRAATPDFEARHGLDAASLCDLLRWDEATFLQRTQGSAIRRIGHQRWLRNVAVALGNAQTSAAVLEALQSRAADPSAIVREHVVWALQQHAARSQSQSDGLARVAQPADMATTDRIKVDRRGATF